VRHSCIATDLKLRSSPFFVIVVELSLALFFQFKPTIITDASSIASGRS
jgi:hypothetical protein